jgi:hypothetical protein
MKYRDEKGRFIKGRKLPKEIELKRAQGIRRAWSNPDYKKRMSKIRTEIQNTQEYREKMSKRLKGRTSPMKGRHHSPEARRKMSEHNTRARLGKRPPEEAIHALLEYNRTHGPWNKMSNDPKDRYRRYCERHVEEIREKARRYYQNNRDKVKASHLKVRMKAIEVLGGKCARCGIEDFRVLQIDHVNGGGLRERRNLSPSRFYKKVIKSAKAGEGKYQVLCANCNMIKKYERQEHPRGRRRTPLG